MKALAAAVVLFGAALAGRPAAVNDAAITGDALPAKLSDYGFFTDLPGETPAPRVIGYDLETPLFSDYAAKHRYLYIPAGRKARYDGEAAFDLPVGSALIKTFGYPQAGKFKPLETRLLLRRASGWVALPYVWNAAGTDALLRRAGTRIPVTFSDPSGTPRSISYAVPNQNQCKDCHALSGAITPIGVKARYLNHAGQLEKLVAADMLDRLPPDAPRVARWDDPAARLDDRARAYLEINCAHCHNPAGAASNSGLFLESGRRDPVALGIGKRPVAAGRGSGGRDFAIQPGDPQASILIYRMESTDPGIAMPELGRATVHAEGVELLREWIEAMPKR
ncbi:SO2930 family diheme c-type cytochrome [Sphingomonas sp. DG1-23]|uniref:SO2930 family diheme c-type cytochrome n=1 Tax=Sphingomonas sp. DG1-23 TaxID=3068316 RepID=UPI00273DEE1F|nr:SO2930 family diheme c-type cytochrome [Sphingomonas sp. DG1-23]MDP5279461.1 SO2930 family diheme c-type cytochrome [Sphingomonas sp. DG1-23]